jgi:hypothetical protein
MMPNRDERGVQAGVGKILLRRYAGVRIDLNSIDYVWASHGYG